jgi:hypothetical protein
MNYWPLRKKLRHSRIFSELFYCFAGITQRGDCVCLARLQLRRRVGVLFLRICFSAQFSLHSGRSVLKSVALKVTQSALLPEITNLAFQRFHLSPEVLAWKMVQMLDSMAARSGSPTAYRELCPPIRTCTSSSTHYPSGHPLDPSIFRRSSKMRTTISGDTRGIRRELHEQIVFRHAQQSPLPLHADWGDNKRESERAQNN